MKIGLIQNRSAGVNKHRLMTPYRYIQGHEINVTRGVLPSDNFDCVIFNRLPNQCLTDLEILKKQGLKVVVDLDDWIEVPDYNFSYSKNKIKLITPILDALNLADAITVSTKQIQLGLKKLGYKSEVLPNFIDTGYKHNPTDHAIGWVGGLGHVKNFLQIASQLRFDYGVKRILGGYTKGEIDSEIYKKIMSANYKYQIETRAGLDIDNYMALYSGITIGLLPSYNDFFSLCKSDLRALEYAVMGIVGVTNGGCYSGTKAIQAQDRDFRKEIVRLISSPSYFKDKQSEQVDWFMKRNDIAGITKKRSQIIDSL